MNEQDAALLMTLIPGVGPAAQRRIVERFGSLSRYFTLPRQPFPAEFAEPWRHFANQRESLVEQVADLQRSLANEGIRLLALAEDDYPSLLKEISRPPPILFVKGDPALLALPQIAIIGSRKASTSGVAQAEDFASALAASGFVITSGLALGIDGAAHRGALRRGRTVAVLGCGVEQPYPRQHHRLYDDILSAGGTIVSEFPPGTAPLRPHFPQRNRIISGLSLGILVVEAAAHSGSLITARLAMEQGREVFAIPGSIHNPYSRGCHQLIREGATLTETLDDIVSQLGGLLAFKAAESKAQDSSHTVPTGVEGQVLEIMGYDPVHPDQLLSRLAVDAGALTTALVNLEIEGRVETSGGLYRRCR